MSDIEPTWLSVLPPIAAIVLALGLRRVVAALSAGVILSALVVNDFALLAALEGALGYLWESINDGGHQWILAFAMSLGGLMRVMRGSGGAGGLAARIAKVARTRRGGQLTAWGMGVAFFFDDYANTLLVGSTMGPVIKRLRISREKLAFIVDATAAPVASLAPISSWIVVELGYIGDQLGALGIPDDPYAVFLSTIPNRFYPIMMLALGVMIAFSGRDFGPMATAEARAERGEEDERSEATAPAGAFSGELPASASAAKGAARLAAVPLALVVVALVIGLWVTGRAGAIEKGLPLTVANVLSNASSSKSMVIACLVGGAAAVFLSVSSGQRTTREVMKDWANGAFRMAPVTAILVLAWALGGACHDMQTARYLVRVLGAGFEAGLLPAAVFMVSAVVSFATGTSWGTMGIIFPLAAPLCHELAPGNQDLMIGTLSSVLAGSVFGDHCSPISDTTIMSALATGCDQVAHVRTQLPYALLAAFAAISFGSIPVGLGWWSTWLAVPLGLGTMYVALRVLAKRRASEPQEPNLVETH